MGKQLGFVMDKHDKEEFLKYVLDKGVIYTCDNYKEQQILQVSELLKNDGWFRVYVTVKSEIPITYTPLSDNRKYIDGISEPVIEILNSAICESDKRIVRGRLWVEMKYFNNEGELITKCRELDELYKDLCKWIRKNLKKVSVELRGRKEYISESLSKIGEKGYKWQG